MEYFSDMLAFVKAHENDLFMCWVYRKLFTPYEQQQAFMDESVFEDSHATLCYIRECVQLENGDFLIGLQSTDDPRDFPNPKLYNVEYYKLSEVRLSLCPVENNEEDESCI